MINIKSLILVIYIVFVNYSVLSDEADNVATTSSDFETTYNEDEIYDPIEPINRAIFGFNNIADKIILEPAAKTYKMLPSPIQSGISNFLSNLRAPLVIVNQLLQGQGGNAAETTGRFLVNTTVGVFGLFDAADKIGLEEKHEDYGQTLAKWRVGDGFYVVLPIFGPSNLRDTAGLLLTVATDPLNAYAIREGEGWIVPIRTATNAVDKRSKIIDEVNALRNNSVDYYAAARSSYHQNRKAAILNIDDSELTPLPLISVEFE